MNVPTGRALPLTLFFETGFHQRCLIASTSSLVKVMTEPATTPPSPHRINGLHARPPKVMVFELPSARVSLYWNNTSCVGESVLVTLLFRGICAVPRILFFFVPAGVLSDWLICLCSQRFGDVWSNAKGTRPAVR